MPITRSTHLLRRAVALAAAPALALTIAACGDDDGGGGGGDSASFCEDVEGPFESVNDPGADPEETIASMRAVDPPAEIADDWDTVISTLEALQDLDAEDAGDADILEQLSDPEIEEAGQNVEDYLTEECGL